MAATEDALMRLLHDQHAPALWHYALRLTDGDHGRAEDVVQETLLRAWRNPQVLDQSERSARGWLFRVARNIAVDQWRSRRARPEVVTDELPAGQAVDVMDDAIAGWVIKDALHRLSDSHREVVVVCFYGGHTTAQAAQRIGVPEGTVKSRLHYGLAALRLVLEEMGVDR